MSWFTRRGTTAVEFALVFPWLAVLVVGIAEFSLFVVHLHTLQRAARDGARVGQLTLEGSDPDGSVITAAAVAQARDVLQANGMPCAPKAGCQVTAQWDELFPMDDTRWVIVTVAVPYPALTGLLPELTQPRMQFSMVTQQQMPPPP